MRFLISLIFITFSLSTLTQCSPPAKDPALIAYENFVFALRSKQESKIWESLSINSQQKFKEKMLTPLPTQESKPNIKENRPSDDVKIEGLLRIKLGYAFENSFAQTPKIEANEIHLSNLKHVLVSQTDQSLLKIPMVYENNAWKVDLSEAKTIE